MPRRPRVVVEGGIYHVHNRWARGALLRLEDNDFRTAYDDTDRRLAELLNPPAE